MSRERTTQPDGRSAAFPDDFDLTLGQLHGLPDVAHTKQSTIQVVTQVVGNAETWIVQTYRMTDPLGDKPSTDETIFLQVIARNRAIRLVVPPRVAAVIARQHDSLTSMNRRKGAQQAVETRKARGIQPAFLKRKRGKLRKGD